MPDGYATLTGYFVFAVRPPWSHGPRDRPLVGSSCRLNRNSPITSFVLLPGADLWPVRNRLSACWKHRPLEKLSTHLSGHSFPYGYVRHFNDSALGSTLLCPSELWDFSHSSDKALTTTGVPNSRLFSLRTVCMNQEQFLRVDSESSSKSSVPTGDNCRGGSCNGILTWTPGASVVLRPPGVSLQDPPLREVSPQSEWNSKICPSGSPSPGPPTSGLLPSGFLRRG